MKNKMITPLGLASLLCMNIQAESAPQGDPESAAKTSPPNVLILWIDDLVPALNTYGMDYAISPNIDKLAARSTVFQRAYCSVPVCGASRASVLTGLHPTPNRFTAFNSRADREAPGITSLPEMFKTNGYETISIGKVFHDRDDHGAAAWSKLDSLDRYDYQFVWLDPESEQWPGPRGRGPFYEKPDVSDWDYFDGMITQRAIDELDRLEGSDAPFFLALGYFNPHLPFYAPLKYWDLYDRDEIPLAEFRERPEGAPSRLTGSNEIRAYGDRDVEYNSEEFHRIAKHGYLACVSYVDALIGHVMGALERNGFADNTIILLMGDHGFHLGEHNFWGKHNLLRGALHTPLMITRPGQESMDFYTPVSLVDVAPTLLDLASLEKPDYFHGHSLVESLDGELDGLEGITYSRWQSGDGVVNNRWIYAEYDNGEAMLLDMGNDPLATRNAIDDDDKADAVNLLKERLDQFRAQAEVVP